MVDEETLKKMKERQARFGETTSKHCSRLKNKKQRKEGLERFGS